MITPYRHWLLPAALALALGCATGGAPRVLEVDRTPINRLITPETAGIKEEFFVSWTGNNISLVKFEYRQVDVPAEIFARSYVPTKRNWTLFKFTEADYKKNGTISAWRVTLWRDKQQLAELKSALW